jgi:hypothetical protein
MQISSDEIDSIEEAGSMDGHPVKLLRTKGGLFIAVGTPRGKFREEALTAGSHPAIVRYNLEKQYPSFHAAMMKSETLIVPVVTKHSGMLEQSLLKSGHDIYAVQSGNNVEFQITKQDIKIGNVKANVEGSDLVIKEMSMQKQFAASIASAATKQADLMGGLKVRVSLK